MEEALSKAKTGEISTRLVEIAARILRMKESILVRVLYAYNKVNAAERALNGRYPWFHLPSYHESGTLQRTEPILERSARVHVLQAFVGKAIQTQNSIRIRATLFVPEEAPAPLCNGCVEQMICAATNLSTPQQCITGRHRYVTALPLSIEHSKVMLSVMQPRETRTLPLWKLAEDGALEAW